MHLSALAHPLPLRSRLLAMVVAVTFGVVSLATAGPAMASTGGDGLRAAANDYRVKDGLAPVVGTDLLDDIAAKRAAQMVSADSMEHDTEYVRKRLDGAGVCWRAMGEIIAWEAHWDSYSYTRTLGMWWASATHHDIIMTAGYNAAGGAWKRGDDGDHYSVMVFVTLCDSELSASLLTVKQSYSPTRRMVFAKGTHTAYRFSDEGAVLGTKQVTLSRRSGADSAGRSKLNGKAYLKVSNGTFAGYWVRESRRSYVRGMTEKRTWNPTKPISFEKGTYTGYTFDKVGRVTERKTASLGRASGADAAARAIINGRPYFKVANGIWAGYWVRDTKSVDRVR